MDKSKQKQKPRKGRKDKDADYLDQIVKEEQDKAQEVKNAQQEDPDASPPADPDSLLVQWAPILQVVILMTIWFLAFIVRIFSVSLCPFNSAGDPVREYHPRVRSLVQLQNN